MDVVDSLVKVEGAVADGVEVCGHWPPCRFSQDAPPVGLPTGRRVFQTGEPAHIPSSVCRFMIRVIGVRRGSSEHR